MPQFGVSTHLFHEQRLDREHLVHIAAHGFDLVEVFATRAHFDYHDEGAIARLGEWLSETRLQLHSMHAPIADAIRGPRWVGSYSIAAADETRRRAAVAEVEAALAVARRIPYRYLVLHVGVPSDHGGPDENQPAAARRSVESILEAAARVHVEVALEVMPNTLSTPTSLVHLIEDDLEAFSLGICLDVGHANVMGDVGEAMESVSGHMWTTHLHDNRGTRDEHLVPYAGTIDWDHAMMVAQKIGYEGALMFEVAGADDPVDVLRGTAKARERLEKALVVF